MTHPSPCDSLACAFVLGALKGPTRLSRVLLGCRLSSYVCSVRCVPYPTLRVSQDRTRLMHKAADPTICSTCIFKKRATRKYGFFRGYCCRQQQQFRLSTTTASPRKRTDGDCTSPWAHLDRRGRKVHDRQATYRHMIHSSTTMVATITSGSPTQDTLLLNPRYADTYRFCRLHDSKKLFVDGRKERKKYNVG